MSRYMSNNFVVPVGFEPTSSHFKRVVHKNHSATRPLCDHDGIRTRDPNIKSVVLYQLSYKVIAELHGCVLRVVAFKPTSVIPGHFHYILVAPTVSAPSSFSVILTKNFLWSHRDSNPEPMIKSHLV